MDENQDIETTDYQESEVVEHVNTCDCDCPDCMSGRNHYVPVVDVDAYLQTLNDWD